MKVKICGITNLADARYAAAAGADYLGFIQYSGSDRYVTPKTAAEIIEWISGPESVGVFVDQDADTVNEIVELSGFDLVQLHGNETVELCSEITQPVIRAVRVRSEDTAESVRARIEPFRRVADFFLIDSFDSALAGGTGKTTDWKLAKELAEDFPLFLAGGLNPENVVEASQTARPMGLDVSSGLESSPGKKDFLRIDAFFESLSDHLQTDASK